MNISDLQAMPDIDPKEIEAKLLANRELVAKILESAENPSVALSPAEFKLWLDTQALERPSVPDGFSESTGANAKAAS